MIDEIFNYYSEKYPDWKLKRYYTKPMRLLDHIYHCMRKGSAKEMLYKAGLACLLQNITGELYIAIKDDINLFKLAPILEPQWR